MISTSFRRWALVVGVALIAALSLVQVASAATPAVTLTPSTAQPGTTVTAKLTGFKTNEDIQIIFRGPGNPVVARGKTDATGSLTLTFVVPDVTSGVYTVFTTNTIDDSCDVNTPLTVIPGPPATPTPTQAPPTATPVRPATPPAPPTQAPPQPPTATPPVPPTPAVIPTVVTQPPVAGNSLFGGDAGSAGTGLLLLGGLITAVASLRLLRISQKKNK